MFKSANHHAFWGKATEVGFTVFCMWFSMLAVIGFFKYSGLFSIDFTHNIPLLGVSANFLWLHEGSITLGQALMSPYVVIGVLGTVLFAPLVEEIIFRGVCGMVSDKEGTIRPRFEFLVLAESNNIRVI